MQHSELEASARELKAAQETGQMVAVPPSARPGFDLDSAYEVEAILKHLRQGEGHRVVGRKVGYANQAMWRVLKLHTLVWAHMYEDTVHYSDGNSATLSIAHPRSLKIEPEIVFGLKRPITSEGNQTPDAIAALEATGWLAIGFEVIDCPYPEWKFQPSDFVASFGLHTALVIGERVEVRPDLIPTLADELSRFKVRISRSSDSKNGEFAEEGSGKNSLKNPALCLAELSTAISKRFPAEPLGAGELVSSGTLTAGHATSAGDAWTAAIEGLSLPMAPLTLRLI
jgi:2-keto-4-pentenoate hydratase